MCVGVGQGAAIIFEGVYFFIGSWGHEPKQQGHEPKQHESKQHEPKQHEPKQHEPKQQNPNLNFLIQ